MSTPLGAVPLLPYYLTISLSRYLTTSLRHYVTTLLRYYVTTLLRYYVTTLPRYHVTTLLHYYVTTNAAPPLPPIAAAAVLLRPFLARHREVGVRYI